MVVWGGVMVVWGRVMVVWGRVMVEGAETQWVRYGYGYGVL